MLSWNAKKDELKNARHIALRANQIDPTYSVQDAEMDIVATHANGCPLRLDELAKARDDDFGHDIFGIRRFLDRHTGQLGGQFFPRFAR